MYYSNYYYSPLYSEADIEDAFLLGYKDASEDAHYYYYMMGKEAGIADFFKSVGRGLKSIGSGVTQDVRSAMAALKNTGTYQGMASGAREVGGALARDAAETMEHLRAGRDAIRSGINKGKEYLANDAAKTMGHVRAGRDAIRSGINKGKEYLANDWANTVSNLDRRSRAIASGAGGWLSRLGDRLTRWANRGKGVSGEMHAIEAGASPQLIGYNASPQLIGYNASPQLIGYNQPRGLLPAPKFASLEDAYLYGYLSMIDELRYVKTASVVNTIISDYMYQNLCKVASEWEDMVRSQVY